MKKSALLMILLMTALIWGCSRESYIKEEIAKANYCTTDSDCVDAGGKCPFDCYVFVNKAEVNRIKDMIDSFDSKCVYDCVMCTHAACLNGKCEPVCEK